MSGAVLVIGGTGKTGARLTRRLVEAGYAPRVASRTGKPASGAPGVVFDWFEEDTHAMALQGVERVYLVAPVGSNDPLPVMEPFIERALSRGVGRFVLLSSSLLEDGGPAMGQVHRFLRARAPEWAALRPSWFMHNFINPPHIDTIREEGAIYSATDDGLVPFISADDIAEVGFRALTDPEPANDGLVINGPDLLTYDDVAARISRASGRLVRHVRTTAAELAARFEAFGLAPDYAAMLAGLDRAIAGGADARTTDTVRRVTGREPARFVDFAAANASAWSSR